MHRVVHGGSVYAHSMLLTDEVESRILELAPLAPLHNPVAARWIASAKQLWKEGVRLEETGGLLANVSHVAVFDTSFFAGLPDESKLYAVPYEWFTKYNIRKYGFHGIAHQCMFENIKQFRQQHFPQLPVVPSRLLTLQLGSGCSVSAIKDGRPVEISMGFSPLSGLVMSTRSGDVDPAIFSYLKDINGWDTAYVEKCLYSSSGIYGLSNFESNSMKDIESSHSIDAQRALNGFIHRLICQIGSFVATLGGVDAIVMGGGIGEHSATIRARVCQHLSFLNVVLDDKANHTCFAPEEMTLISPIQHQIQVYVCPVDEASIMIREAALVMKREKRNILQEEANSNY